VEDLALACGENSPLAAPDEKEAGLLEAQVTALEKRLIMTALTDSQHNHTHAARQLGISRVGLLNKMRRYGLR
jgi:DNA-binding NtrC family response regulator